MRETCLLETLAHFAFNGVQATLDALEQTSQARCHVYREQISWEYAGGTFG